MYTKSVHVGYFPPPIKTGFQQLVLELISIFGHFNFVYSYYYMKSYGIFQTALFK